MQRDSFHLLGQASTTSWSSSIRVAFRWGMGGMRRDLQRPYLFTPSQKETSSTGLWENKVVWAMILNQEGSPMYSSEQKMHKKIGAWKVISIVWVTVFPTKIEFNSQQFATHCQVKWFEVNLCGRFFSFFMQVIFKKSALIKHGVDFPTNIAITYVSFYWLGVFAWASEAVVWGVPQSSVMFFSNDG